MTTTTRDIEITKGATSVLVVENCVREGGAAINWAFPAVARMTIKLFPSDADGAAISILVSPTNIAIDSVTSKLTVTIPASVFSSFTLSRWVHYSVKVTDNVVTPVLAGRIWVRVVADSVV